MTANTVRMVDTDNAELRELYGEPREGWVVYGAENGDQPGEIEVVRRVMWDTGRPKSIQDWECFTYDSRGYPTYFEGYCTLEDVQISAMGVLRVYWDREEAYKDAREEIENIAQMWRENLEALDAAQKGER